MDLDLNAASAAGPIVGEWALGVGGGVVEGGGISVIPLAAVFLPFFSVAILHSVSIVAFPSISTVAGIWIGLPLV